jgi:uncharacterized repeat protein (TIGR03803 family)
MSLRDADLIFGAGRIAVISILGTSLALSGCGGGDNAGNTSPAAQTFSLSGTVSGLNSSGLVLMVNGTAVSVAASVTSQSLATSLPSGTSYTVTVMTQPTGETCSVAGGTGTIGSAHVGNVVVTCSDGAYSLGGTVSGLNGAGLVLANGSDTISVSSGATSFTIQTPVAYGSSYAVIVKTQPAGLACAVSKGTGSMPASAVTTIAVSCTDQPFTLGGTITGLGNYTGLVLTNGATSLSVSAGSTSFTMPTAVSFGSTYAVVVQSAPAGLTCTASHASGTMPAGNVTNLAVTCSDQAYLVGGSITGLTAAGLVLANGTDTLAVSTGATSFAMPTAVAYTSPYTLTVQTQPAGLTCSVSNGTGTMGTVAVNNIVVTCASNTYTVGGSISGLTTTGLVLLNNGADATPINANAAQFTMAGGQPSSSAYAITVQTQPTGETCSVAGGTGTIELANVANVVVTCSDQAYSLGGTIGGLNGSGLVLANGGDTLTVNSGAASFAMPAPVAYTSSYAVTVQTQPAGLACAVSNGTGTMPASAVTNITVTCTDQPFTLGGTITGLGNSTGLVLTNGSDTLDVAAGSNSFTMPTPVPFGSAYSVAVQTTPAGLTCTASNVSGTMPAGNVTNVVIACSDQSYTVGGTVSGLTTAGLMLANGSDALSVSSGATSFQMDQPVAYTSSYDVTAQTQPTGLTCSVSNGTGTMGTAAVTNVAVTCSVNTYTVGGPITGLTASGLVLIDNGGDATTIDANANQFSMNTGIAYGAGYAVTVQTQPVGLICSVSNGTGTVGGGDVTSVSISCISNTTIMYSFSFAAGGLPQGGLILASDGNFYGTLYEGGPDEYGGVFKMTPSGTESILYYFGNTPESDPMAGVVQGTDGNLYGTGYGHYSAAAGTELWGAVFQVTLGGSNTVLHTFGAAGDGASPAAGLIQASDGNFYGTTYEGGSGGAGTVFKITSSGAETILYSFAGEPTDGANPYGILIQGSDGNFYGTTGNGGANNFGTVFRITPTGTETVLYSFAGGTLDGKQPHAGLVQGIDGDFYGTTTSGGTSDAGTVFRVTPTGAETVLYSFAGGTSDGANPLAGLIQGGDGNFYGTTWLGGASGDGTVFKISPSGTETVLHIFTGAPGDGAQPYAPLLQGSDGSLYGTTFVGGANSDGTVFKVTLQ